jgi:dUTP pyrophosphatase
MNIPVDIFRIHPDAILPEYKTKGAVAFDLAVVESKTVNPGETVFFNTGLVVCTPKNHALILAPRSSNSKKGIVLANSIGIIDEDYCGPEDQLKLALHNILQKPYTVEKGERIAQGIFIPISRAAFNEVKELTNNNRGGFGTTG